MVRPREEFLGSITLLDEDGYGLINANDANIYNILSTIYNSRVSAPVTGIGIGSFWVESTSPTLPKFTDSNGTTITLGTSIGAASGDLDGYYPNPNVISATFNGEQIYFDTSIEDGYILQRSGNSIIGIDPISIIGPGYPVGDAGGDLDSTYPNPEVIAAQFDAERLTFGTVIDGGVLVRNGSEIISQSEMGGDLDGYFPNPDVIAAQFDTERLTFGYLDDGYILRRIGSEISGINVLSLIEELSGNIDGYVPTTEGLTASVVGQTVFTLTYEPYQDWVELFIGGIKQELNDYSVSGNQLTWLGSLVIEVTDIIEVSYSRIVTFSAIIESSSAPIGSAGGDLDGSYPNPDVISATFNGERIYFNIPIEDGYILQRSGNSIIGIDPVSIIGPGYPVGDAGGDLDSTYPNPEVIAAQFDTERLTFGTVTNGEVLIRNGSEITSQAGANPIGNAGGDLDGTYPNPEVIAAQFDAERLTFGIVGDGNLLQRIGLSVISVNPDNLLINGDVVGTLGTSVVQSAYFDSLTLSFGDVPDGYVLQRIGTDIIGLDPNVIISNAINDGYLPINESLTITTPSQTLFTLSDTPYNNECLLFINGVKQNITDYSISGNQLTWLGTLDIILTDIIEVSYFKLIIDGGGYILSGQTLADTLLFGNSTNGNNIELSIGDFITSAAGVVSILGDGYVSNDFEISGKLTVAGLIDPTGLVLDEMESNPNNNPSIGKETLWIRNSDKNIIVTHSDGYSAILPKKFEFSDTTSTLESTIVGDIDLSLMTAETAICIKINTIAYRPFNTAGGVTYKETCLILRKEYLADYYLVSNVDLVTQGSTESFTIDVSIIDSLISIILTNTELVDQLHFSGSYEIIGME